MPNKVATALTTVLLAFSLRNSIYNEPHNEFKTWQDLHAKHYDQDEYAYRYNVFKLAVERVKEHNAKAQVGEESYFLGLNQFSDMPDWEFSEKYLQGYRAMDSNYACTGAQPVVKEMPESFDWSAKSATTSVRKLGTTCAKGAYAVVAAETIESGRFITTGKLIQASPQQIIDCSSAEGNKGCTDGNVLNSFEYVLKHGITGEARYPFAAKNGSCTYTVSMKEWQILGCTKVSAQNQTLIRAAVYRQPVAASINATLTKFKDYSSGVFDSSGGVFSGCKANPSHWVTIVGFGYDTSSKKKYWKLKNSWGADWGSQGYMFIVRTGDGAGECGIQNEVFYPLD